MYWQITFNKVLAHFIHLINWHLIFSQDSLSEKILEYHESGYIENLIRLHFADAECYKQRLSQEESRLDASHHVGLFVLLTVGLFIGVFVLLLEHVVFKWLVPYFRLQSGHNNFWTSHHVMFFSQVRKPFCSFVVLVH